MNFQLPDVSGLPASLQSASQNAPDKLLQAGTLSTMAKVAIARLPEQILRISVPGAEKRVELDLRLPSPTLVKDNAPTFIARPPGKNTSTAVLMQALEQRVQQPLNTKAEAALTQYITRLTQAQPQTAMTIQARVVSVSENSLSLSVDNRKNQLDISLPVKGSQTGLKPNDPVNVSLKPLPKGGFEIAITPKPASQAPLVTSTIKAGSDAANALINAKLSQTGVTLKQTDLVPVPKPLERHIPAMSSRSMPSAPPVEQMLFVKVERSVAGMPELHARQVALQAVAKASIPPDINQQLRIPVLAKSMVTASTIAAVPEARVQPLMLHPPGTSGAISDRAFSTVSVEPKAGVETAAASQAGKAKLKLPPQEQEKVHAQIIELSRALLKDTGSTKEALSQLIQILKTGNINTGAQTKQTISQVLAAIQGADPRPIKPDTGLATETGIPVEGNKSQPSTLSQQIQSLMTTPALNLTPVQLTTPAPANNLVAGLVMLLQLTLAGRAINRQPALAAQADAPEQLLQKVVPQSGPTSAPSRVSQELASLESRSQFLNQVKTLLANHQQQKLSQADSRLQGQDSLYYVLPVTSQKGAPPEILIRADERGSRQAESSDSKRKLWNVTMKLDVGDFGELLAKSRIDGDVIELDLYTSTDALLQRVADTLPLLKRRLTALGLEVAQSSFQRGKIPSTLQNRPYHIFETQA